MTCLSGRAAGERRRLARGRGHARDLRVVDVAGGTRRQGRDHHHRRAPYAARDHGRLRRLRGREPQSGRHVPLRQISRPGRRAGGRFLSLLPRRQAESAGFFCGIDVSKDRLDVVVLPKGWFFSVSNDTAGCAELVVRLRPLAVSAIGLEPSGGYERGIIRALLAAGLSVRRINPSKLRQFARARGVLAKNDRLDARLIAEYVAIMPTRVVQRDAAVERLAEIVTMRRQLCDEHVAAENQAAHLEDAMLRRLSKRRQMRLEADILLLDKRMAEIVASNANLA